MEELFAALLSSVADALCEILLQVVLEAIVALIDRSTRKLSEGQSPITPVFAVAGYLSLGILCGFASLMLFPYPIFHPSKFHGISLLISPILTGLAMSLTGIELRKSGKRPAGIESFGYGFTFALGMAFMRFLFFT
jgi:hypothetical protein